MKKTGFCDGWLFGEPGNEKKPVLIPHDATQTRGRSADARSGSGGAYYLDGSYEYSKRFTVPESWNGQYVSLLFEGVYPQASVLLNGQEIGGCMYGYSLFEVPLAGLKYGEENEITVIVKHQSPDSRWYAGAGIYRPVWLLQGNPSHIPFGGLRITTLSYAPAVIQVDTSQVGDGQIEVEILDGESVIAVGSGSSVTFSVPNARLWDVDHPNLYTCKAILKNQNTILDKAVSSFGIRKVEYGRDGLVVNGRKTLLKGGCIHSDNGILGSRSFDESEWRRVRILKKYGFNAIRSAHNPLCRAALEASDQLGMYVMDETWDMWYRHKTDCDYAGRFADSWKEDVEALITKDYNHPSVIMYSIGNEVTEPAEEKGVHLAGEIISEIKKRDPTRPVTAGMNVTLLLMAAGGINMSGSDAPEQKPEEKKPASSTDFNEQMAKQCEGMVMAAALEEADKLSSPTLDQLDIAGLNYGQSRYENEQSLHPGRVVVGSETFPQDLPANWALVEKLPWVIGDFMWTAWDYLGEVGIGAWTSDREDRSFAKPYPWKLADTGALDILGHETAEAGMAAVVWGARKTPYIAVRPMLPKGQVWLRAMWRGSNAIPSWSWDSFAGRETEVEVYTRASEAELFINGVSAGKQSVTDCRAVFRVVYQPGVLEAVAYFDDGSQTRNTLCSADQDTHITVKPETIPEAGKLLYADISIRGDNGEIESSADETLTVSVKGGKLLAFGSANPKSEESYTSGTYTTYRGRALAAILPESDDLEIRVSSKIKQALWKSGLAE